MPLPLCSYSSCGVGAGRVIGLSGSPCTLLTAGDVASALDARVTRIERVAGIQRVIAAQAAEGGEGDIPVADRRLCVYSTTSDLGEVNVFVPGPGDRRFDPRRSSGCPSNSPARRLAGCW